MTDKYKDLIATIMEETRCVSEIFDPILGDLAQELAEGVTAERDAEIAESLPVPYQKKVPARAQIDGDYLTIPRCVIATATRAEGGEWITSTKGPRMGRNKAGCAIGLHEELVIPGVVEIVRIVILWKRDKRGDYGDFGSPGIEGTSERGTSE